MICVIQTVIVLRSCTVLNLKLDLSRFQNLNPGRDTRAEPINSKRTQTPNRTLGRSQEQDASAHGDSHVTTNGNTRSCTRSEVGKDQPLRSVLNPDDLRLVLHLRVVLIHPRPRSRRLYGFRHHRPRSTVRGLLSFGIFVLLLNSNHGPRARASPQTTHVCFQKRVSVKRSYGCM